MCLRPARGILFSLDGVSVGGMGAVSTSSNRVSVHDAGIMPEIIEPLTPPPSPLLASPPPVALFQKQRRATRRSTPSGITSNISTSPGEISCTQSVTAGKGRVLTPTEGDRVARVLGRLALISAMAAGPAAAGNKIGGIGWEGGATMEMKTTECATRGGWKPAAAGFGGTTMRYKCAFVIPRFCFWGRGVLHPVLLPLLQISLLPCPNLVIFFRESKDG